MDENPELIKLQSWLKKEGKKYSIRKLRSLKELDLSGNQLSTLPIEIGELKNLEYLDLSDNQLSTLPIEIGELKNLKGLYLDHNQLSTLPIEIGKLKNLKGLFLRNNQLSTLPIEIGKLKNLEYLNLDDNQLSTFPNEIGELKNLEYLDLSDNQLSTLPNEIGELKSLFELELINNPLEFLPEEISNLQKLYHLYLDQNQLKSIKDFHNIAKSLHTGCSIYIGRVEMSRSYLETPVEEWKPEWIFKETNVDIRKILIKVMGYEKMMCDLNFDLIHTEKDSKGNIMELRRNDTIDFEPMNLLKVQCPSTNAIHILRVPPDIIECEKARRWTLYGDLFDIEFIEET